jgi:hypothetical protein
MPVTVHPSAPSPAPSSAPSSGELSRARTARRAVAVLLVLVGVAACALSLLQVTGGVAGQARLVVTIAFLLLGPGWAAAGFLRRAPAAHVWLLTVGVGVATTLLIGQAMVMTGWWAPTGALYVTTLLSVPFLLRHAVVAQ